MHRCLCTLLWLPALLALATTPAHAEVHEVLVISNQFIPPTVTIDQGDVVRWVWGDGIHTVTSGPPCTPDGLFDRDITMAMPIFEFTFNTAGEYPYFCTPHCLLSNMVGSVTVQDPAGTDDLPQQAEGPRILGAAPNPFSPRTVVSIELPAAGRTRVDVFRIDGSRVTTLIDADLSAGIHSIPWDGRAADGVEVPSGLYYARCVSGGRDGSAATLVCVRS